MRKSRLKLYFYLRKLKKEEHIKSKLCIKKKIIITAKNQYNLKYTPPDVKGEGGEQAIMLMDFKRMLKWQSLYQTD